MTSIEIQDHIHVYSMITFRDGKRIPGIVVNKYNVETTSIEFYFIAHTDMQNYKTAFEKYDRATCNSLSRLLDIREIINIKPVSLADYKIIMQLIDEQQQLLNSYR